MANDFSLAGRQDVVICRTIGADNTWIPTSTASQYKDSMGNALNQSILDEISGVGANNGFKQMANVMVGVTFYGIVAAAVELQEYIASYPGGAAWKTSIPSADWTNGQTKIIQGSILPWRVGAVTWGSDASLVVVVRYLPAKDG